MSGDQKYSYDLGIENCGKGPFIDDKEVFLASIAISLKRIADHLCGDESRMSPLEYIAHVLERRP